MKKVISIALFGDASRKDGSGTNYHQYLPSFVLAHHNLFPRVEGWELHVYVDPTTMASVHGRMLRELQDHKLVEVTDMGDAVHTRAMLWRMASVYSGDAEYVFPRDIDALPLPRDRAVCDVFIASNCAVHTVHDSSSHAGVMGGLCGFQSAAFKNACGIHSLQGLYDFAAKTESEWALHGTDQDVLNRLIDRHGGPTMLEHRYNGWHAGPATFPTRGAGSYRCRSWSTPMPDKGKAALLSEELRETADRLANHLGSAGYPIDAARAFWEAHGDLQVAATVRACEALATMPQTVEVPEVREVEALEV